MRPLLFLSILLFCAAETFSQPANRRILFVIDSIPVLTDPEDWNQITKDDIADVSVITDKDSLKILGWEKMDAITYVFTKAYRNRPDSIKKIPGLKQMVFKNGAWHLNNTPYTGKYIDYYNTGRIQDEGIFNNGKLNGKLIVYFKNGRIKSVADYKAGILNGTKNEYYKNGALLSSTNFVEGKSNYSDDFFINGQKKWEKKLKMRTAYDTVINYYSTGKMNNVRLIKNGELVRAKNENDLNYYSTMFTQYLQKGDIKAAREMIYKRWLIDSTSKEAHMYEGMILSKEFRFNDAISEFDKVLSLEPLDWNALVERGFARTKKYKYINSIVVPDTYLTVNDLKSIPENELRQICSDFLKADEIDPSDYNVKRRVSEAVLNFCAEKMANKQ